MLALILRKERSPCISFLHVLICTILLGVVIPTKATLPQIPITESGSTSFGASVAISGDGHTAIVGDPGYNGAAGLAWVFVQNEGEWQLQSTLFSGEVPPVSNLGYFGTAVALSSDGNSALIGAPGDGTGPGNLMPGKAYLFTRSASTWSKKVTFLGDGQGGAFFGSSVALSGDGDTALIGAPGDEIGEGTDRGTVYIYKSPYMTPTVPSLFPSDEQDFDIFGTSVALTPDGTMAIVGAPTGTALAGGPPSTGDNREGAAYIFQVSPWSQIAKLHSGDMAANNLFGISVAISSANNITLALAGAPGAGSMRQGAAYMFNSATAWNAPVSSLMGDSSFYNLGQAVALSGNGMYAVIGAPGGTTVGGGGISAGIAYLLAGDGTSFGATPTEIEAVIPLAAGRYGQAVSLSDDGSGFLIGAPQALPGETNTQGISYIYTDNIFSNGFEAQSP